MKLHLVHISNISNNNFTHKMCAWVCAGGGGVNHPMQIVTVWMLIDVNVKLLK